MNDELDRHLDGDTDHRHLDDDARVEADAWERMVASFRSAAPHAPAPPWLEQRVMAELEALPEAGGLRRALDWFLNPRPVRISPLAGALAMAAFAVVIVLPGRGDLQTPVVGPSDGPDASVGFATTSGDAPMIYVQFVLAAPGARSVAVAGDFSDWEPTGSLKDVDGDGVWTGRVPVRPGVHTYMFLIDGAEWTTDPNAERYQDDGFGNRNAVLAVAAGA